MRRILFFLLSVYVLHGCRSGRQMTGSDTGSGMVIHGKLFTTVYQQTAAEYRALCYQAFNAARWQLSNYRAVSSKPLAIITDVDETVLDNSPYAVNRGLKGLDYEAASWFDWTGRASAKPVPGALEFLTYAASARVEIFYITNRAANERASTIRNLQALGFPNADSAHLFTKMDVSGKEPRRQSVMNTHEVVLLMGDNLPDFSNLFDKKSTEDRNRQVEELRNSFGNRFIILPNPVYGDWEGSIYNYQYQLTDKQKDSAIKKQLTGY